MIKKIFWKFWKYLIVQVSAKVTNFIKKAKIAGLQVYNNIESKNITELFC